MIRIRSGRVAAIEHEYGDLTELRVRIDGEETDEPAVNYDGLTGRVKVGDRVLLNTTARHLGLGTGGVHFVMGNEGARTEWRGPGHIVKCRYTPSQVTVLAVEEADSPYHEAMRDGDLEGTPVIAASLHSMMAAAAVAARRRAPSLRVVYVMTDGAALPAAFSRLVRRLRASGYLQSVVTCGHAFGGDFEAVTLHSGLLAARKAARADLILVAMGPGAVGTGTTWGTTAIEVGIALDAASILGGRAIAAPRLSFADPRPRHHGLSHHTLTALGRVAQRRCEVALPRLSGDERARVELQLSESGIAQRHRVGWYEVPEPSELLSDLPFRITTMGRGPEEDPHPFAAAFAAVEAALRGEDG